MPDDGLTPDWDALTEEATELLSAYIRVDTVNPPGNETRACEFIGAILDREGIPYKLYEPADATGRATLLATLPGDGTGGKQLILLNHTDVVPFEREHWTVDPLGGEVSEGYIWGRGTLDMKGMGIMELITFLLHHRHKLPLRRDLTFIAVADEEAGSAYGAEFLAREHPELIDCVCVINEGGRGSTRAFGVERPLMQIGVAEKIPFWVRLRTQGRPGHGSVPTLDNAADRLVRALQRILDWERPPHIGPELRAYFEGLHAAGLFEDEPTSEVIEQVAARQPRVGALLRNTISVTTLQSGVKHNVIPAGASATLDCRLVPGSDPDAFLAELVEVIADDQVEVEVVLAATARPRRSTRSCTRRCRGPCATRSRTPSSSRGPRPGSRTRASSAATAIRRTASCPSSCRPRTRRSRTATTSASRSTACGWACRSCTTPCAPCAGRRPRRRRAQTASRPSTTAPSLWLMAGQTKQCRE